VVVVVVATLLNQTVALEAQVVAVAVVVRITLFMLLFMDSTVNQPESMHIQVLITQVEEEVLADTMQIIHTVLADAVAQESLLLDTNRKNYERNTKD
jgi:hypothetical protein